MASKLQYHEVKEALEVTQGKATLKKSTVFVHPRTKEEIKVSAGESFKKHIAGTHVVAKFDIVGMADPALYLYLHANGPNWRDGLKFHHDDSVVMTDKDGSYHVMPMHDVAYPLRRQREESQN